MAWPARDRALAEALIEYEASIGPHGIPWRVALDPESDGWLEVSEQVDYAQAAIEQWEERHKGQRTPGARLVVRDARVSDAGGDEDHADDGHEDGRPHHGDRADEDRAAGPDRAGRRTGQSLDDPHDEERQA